MENTFLIRCDANNKNGFGHFSRCLNLARGIREKRSEAKIVFLGDYDEVPTQLIEKYKMETHTLFDSIDDEENFAEGFDYFVLDNYLIDQVSKLMIKKRIHVDGANVLIMGLTFKENCPDLRNTRVVDLVTEFENFGSNVDVCDPWVGESDISDKYRIIPFNELKGSFYDAIILAVAHDEFKQLTIKDFNKLGCENYVLYDIKYILNANEVDGRL